MNRSSTLSLKVYDTKTDIDVTAATRGIKTLKKLVTVTAVSGNRGVL
jgi:hypothetical protein